MAHPGYPVIPDNSLVSAIKPLINEAIRALPLPHVATSATVTADLSLYRVFHLDTTSNNVTLELPDPAGDTDDQGVWIIVKRTSAGANTATIDPSGSVNIDGSSTLAIASQWDCVVLYSDATQWYEASAT
jgi:hypothetical protein